MLLAIFCSLFLCIIACFPAPVLAGAQSGITIFFTSVLPALLPYFIGSSILVQTGVLQSCRRVQPAFLLSCISGYPTGARVTAELYAQRQLTQAQAKRSIALASTAGPSFILSAVATGMLQKPACGLFILVPHLLSAILTGAIVCLLVPAKKSTAHPTPIQPLPAATIVVDSIKRSMIDLLQVGAFVIFFSALIQLLLHLGILGFFSRILAFPLSLLGLPDTVAEGAAAGFIEMTKGCSLIADTSTSLTAKLITICTIVSFGGISVLFQCYTYASKCGISLRFLLFTKIIQACIALAFASLTMALFSPAISAFAPSIPPTENVLPDCLTLFAGGIVLFLAGACLAWHHLRRFPRPKRK